MAGQERMVRYSIPSEWRSEEEDNVVPYFIPSEWRDAKGGDPSPPLNPLPFPLLILIRSCLTLVKHLTR
ncbi:hypothetical protein L484_001170 [Morus notabilis]|uniref:Uncharacterized protein n=1 Tax=Morus notabilis TaxID=981085 RepID=W9QQ96_9ROSA|nr:hypothetical protein L484_001170 [Morus notabilis]